MFNHNEIQKLRVLETARSFETSFIEIGYVVSEILMFRDFYILIHNLQTKNPITMKFNRNLWGNYTFHLQLISRKSVQPSLRKMSEFKQPQDNFSLHNF